MAGIAIFRAPSHGLVDDSTMQRLPLIHAQRCACPDRCWVIGTIVSLSLMFGGFITVSAEGVRQILYTKHHTFFIPFSTSELPNSESFKQVDSPPQVQLFVSSDRGRSWHPYQTRDRRENRFSFRAGQDGEFWFCVANYGAPQDSSKQPQLKVFVDSRPPEVDFRARRNAVGQVEISWNCNDITLDPCTIQLQYRLDTLSQWEPIGLEIPGVSPCQVEMMGVVKWWPPRAPKCEVRAMVQDKSGNTAARTKRLELADLPVVEPSSEAVAVKPKQSTTTSTTNLPPGLASPQPSSAVGSKHQLANVPPHHPQVQLPVPLSTPQKSPRPSPTPAPVGTGAQFSPNMPVPVAAEQKVQQQPDLVAPASPSGSVPRLTNSRRFHLDYTVEEARAENIDKVEVWWIRDGGNQWERMGFDEDLKSPYLVEIEEDGTFGFAILIKPHEGVTPSPPQNGRTADIRICVDTFSPEGRITAARYGTGIHQGCLHIFWEANDQNLTTLPISLAVSKSPEGPWQNIVSGIANTGRYDWLVNRPLPGEIYLRLVIEDAAGNRAVTVLPEPISSFGLAPRGRIQGIRPASVFRRFRPTPVVRQ